MIVKYPSILLIVSTLALTSCTPANQNISSPAPSPGIITPSFTPIPSPSIASKIQPTAVPKTTPQPIPTIAPLPALPGISQPPQVGDYQVIDELKQPQFMADSREMFKSTKLPVAKVDFNPADLLVVLTSTRKYFQDQLESDSDLQRTGILGMQGVKVSEVIKTLEFMIGTLREDITAKRAIRLQDPKFINKNFKAISWTAFNPAIKDEKRLRLTKYAVFTHPGSRTPTKQFNIGLYALKPDTDAEQLRLKYTKQDVLTNIYEAKGKEFGNVEPLAYLDREGLESALMEGTVLIKFTDGTSGYFNVDRNNGIPFVKGLTPVDQKRYWYFRSVDNIKGYGSSIESKISLKPGVTFAGDILNIGLGRIIVLEHSQAGKQHLRMGIIADTGGAFLPNLHQLDFLAGVFDSKEDFNSYTRKLPEYAKAYILVKR